MSLPNSLLRLWAARVASKIAICSAMTYDLYQLSKARGKEGSMKLAVNDDTRRQIRVGGQKEKRTVEDIFVESLVAAGACREHAPWRAPRRVGAVRTKCDGMKLPKRVRMVPVRDFSTFKPRQQAGLAAAFEDPEITREEYNELVDTYDSPSDLWDKPQHDALQRTASPSRFPTLLAPDNTEQHPPLAPRLVITPEQEAQPPYTRRAVLPPEDDSHSASIDFLRQVLRRDLGRISHTAFWDTYRSLRAPRLRYLADDDIRRAFRHLSWVEYRDTEGAMSRYFALLEECVAEGIPVKIEEWNTAIAFAGRWVRHTTSKEVKYAVETWMRMETEGQTVADDVTFNILFDVAVKAGRFALADTIFHELEARDMPLTRYFRTSMIYYGGMRGDGEAVRQAFRDLVNAGEIIDTVVMNCVIISLVRAGEAAAAENVFLRMKHLVEKKMGADHQGGGWRQDRELGSVLDKTAKELRRERKQHEQSFFGSQYSADQRKEEVQQLTPIAPNARTYRILIQHHAITSGDMGRIQELLREMEDKGFKVQGSLYTHLFRGFSRHGGWAYTGWNWKALQGFWDRFLAAAADRSAASDVSSMDDAFTLKQSEEDHAPCFTRGLAHAAITAWYKCAGRKKMLEVWEVVREKGDMSQDDLVMLQSLVDKLNLLCGGVRARAAVLKRVE
ncbi:hypothetical protein LTR02_001670 [Friedmanniomyces endolithicus]|nr:hypothetical protein LTR75_000956 [Friedmanniomyces endolithicus]KAK0851806.1 hypothetical protein LTR03_003830 [Friedmanniomyces endolithicus]KAK0869338.1 hypothetical protein LTS02_003106 [Friedmanniomyces endolithicus]KAK0878004.1 hypothetical protein LTR87_008184 [Friedmanniomyces endolithicus]KAK0914572.1 hypothetical protein LTR02_001670 [Friedmanniomyces endolithicus]